MEIWLKGIMGSRAVILLAGGNLRIHHALLETSVNWVGYKG
jgi:hypothetical protein